MRPALKSNFIIVLNDNNMSISENVGGMSDYLGESPYSGRHILDLKTGCRRYLERDSGATARSL